jgi:hypothetical protein
MEMGFWCIDCIYLTQDTERYGPLVDAVMNLFVGNFLTELAVSFQE